MSTSHGRRILLLGVAASAASAVGSCAELPSAASGPVPLELQIVSAGPIIIGDTVALRAEAHDPSGHVLMDPPLLWRIVHTAPTAPLVVISEEGGTLSLEGLMPWSVAVEVSIPSGHPHFSAEPVAVQVPVRYGPMTVAFEGVGSDTTVHSRGELRLRASAVDHRDRPVGYGTFVGAVQADTIASVSWVIGEWLSVDIARPGQTRIVLSHSECTACGDTLLLTIDPVPTSLEVHPGAAILTSFGETLWMHTILKDAQGFEVEDWPEPTKWSLPDGGGVLDPDSILEGLALARANGWAQVRAQVGSLLGDTGVRVHQRVATIEAEGLEDVVVGLGTSDTLHIHAWDARGYAVSESHAPALYFASTSPATATLTPLGGRSAVLTSVDYGVTFLGSSVDFVNWSHTLHVVPVADSLHVRAEPPVVAPEERSVLTADAWAEGELVPDVHVTWTALDPAVAVLEEGRIARGIEVGTARFRADLGGVTAEVTVDVEPPGGS